MDSKPKLSSSSREMRNIAEKMRRDKLNKYVSELASIVPLVCGSSKRIDKTSVLRLAANYIRLHNILGDSEEEKLPAAPAPVRGGLMNSLEEAIGGFLLVVTSLGKVVFVTEAVESLFGYHQVDLLGNSIYNVIHPEDHDIVKEQLDTKDESRRRSFFCRMLEKALSRNDPSRYEIIHIVGTLKPLPERWPSGGPTTPLKPKSELTDGEQSDLEEEDEDDDDDETRSGTSSSTTSSTRVGTHMLVSFVRLVKDRPITELSLVESTQDEYITRHTMDGKILYTDHRISFVTGLMPTEVLGTSAFKYMHSEDMVWSMVAHKLMFSSTQGQGIVSYRLKCKGGTMVTLRSRGYIELSKQTGQAETFVCINTVISDKEAKNEIRNQRRKLLPVISGQQSEDHLTSVSSMMPPELISMMKQLMDPKTLQKMISDADAVLNFDLNLEPYSMQQERFEELSDAEEGLHPKSKYGKHHHQETTSSKSYHKPLEDGVKKKPSTASRKRNSQDSMCAIPPKIPNQSNISKEITDVYHQSYSPQETVPLPNLSPNAIQPILSHSSPSQQVPHKKLSFAQNNSCLGNSSNSSSGNGNSIHLSMEGHSKACTSDLHAQRNCKFEGLESSSYQPIMRNNTPIKGNNYQDCRQGNENFFDSFSHSKDHSQGVDSQTEGSCRHPGRKTRKGGMYQSQSILEGISNACTYPVRYSNEDQPVYPQYIGSTNGLDQDRRDIHMAAHVNASPSYPLSYTGFHQGSHQSLCSSVPEFDIKLQRQQQQLQQHHLHHHHHNFHQESLLFHQKSHLPNGSYCPSQHGMHHTQQECLPQSVAIPQPNALGNPLVTSTEAFLNIPNNQCLAPVADHQGGVYNMEGSSSSPVPGVYEKMLLHPHGRNFIPKVADPFSDQQF